MPNTPTHALPYPAATATPDVPRDISALAGRLDDVLLSAGQSTGTTNASGAVAMPIPSGHKLVSATIAQATANPYVLTITSASIVTVKRSDTGALATATALTIGWVSVKA